MMTTKDKEFSQRDIKETFDLCERTCPRYRTKKKNISMLDKTETLGVCSTCGLQMPDQCDLLKCNNLVKTSRMSSAKSKHFKSSSLEKEKKDNLMLKIYHTKTYLHKADTKFEKSNVPDLTLPKLFDSPNNSLILGQQSFFLRHESPGNNNVYEPLPGIKKVYDKTSLTEKVKKTYDESFRFVFPTENKQPKHRRRVSLTKLVHNVQGKVEKEAEKDEKPQLQNKTKKENEEKFDRRPKLKDKSILSDNSKIEEKTFQGDKVKLGDEKKQGDKTKLGNETRIEDIAKLVNQTNLDYKTKLNEKLSDKFKIEEKTKLGYTAQIRDETKQENQIKLENRTNIKDKANIGVKPKLDSKLPLENNTKREDKFKTVYNEETILGNGTKIGDKAKLVHKANLDYTKPKENQSDKSKIEEKTKLEFRAQIGDETKHEDKIKLENRTNKKNKANITVKPRLDSKLPLENKTKLEDKFKIVPNDENLGDEAKLGNGTKIEDIAKLVNKANLDLPKLKEKLSDKSKIEEKTKLGYTAQIRDETKQENKIKLENRTNIKDKANIGVKPKLDSKLSLETKAKLEDKYKTEYNEENLGDKIKFGNRSKIEDIAKLVNEAKFFNKPEVKEKVSDQSKIEQKTKHRHTAQMDETKQIYKTKLENRSKIEENANIGVQPKLDPKLPLENKTKLEDKYKIGYNDETLEDKTKLGNITKIGEINRIEEVILKKVHNAIREKQELNKIKEQVYPSSVQNCLLIGNDNMNTLIELGEKHNKMKKTTKGSEFEKQSLLKKQQVEKAMREIIQKSPIVEVSPLSSLESHKDDSIIIDYSHDKENDDTDFMIIGNKIFKYTKPKTKQGSLPQHETETRKTTLTNMSSLSKKENENNPVEADSNGILRFALSNPKFVDMGWTKLPIQKVVRKVNVYRMRPSHPEYDWFTKNKGKKQMWYDSGETMALFDDDGSGQWFYRNGHLALDYYNAEESDAKQRYVVYSSEETDERGRSRPRTVLAAFDHLGNGIIFDHSGKVRLKYDQNEGVVLDRSIGPKSHWKWHALNDPPVLQNVIIDTQLPLKDPRITSLNKKSEDEGHTAQKTKRCKDMLAIEYNNYIRDKRKKMSQGYKPYQIKMKAFKINQHFSLKILDQATIYLIYRDGTCSIKLNIGMRLDPTEMLDTVSCDLGDVFNTLERFPAPTESIAALQRIVQHARDAKRARELHEQRLRPLELNASADLLRAGLSLRRQPLITYSAPVMNMVPCDPVEAHVCGPMRSVISQPCSFKLYCDECDD